MSFLIFLCIFRTVAFISRSTTVCDLSTHSTYRYVQEDILQQDDPNYRQFHKIFEAFKLVDPPDPKLDDANMLNVSAVVAKAAEASKRLAAQQRLDESDDDEMEEENVSAPVIKNDFETPIWCS